MVDPEPKLSPGCLNGPEANRACEYVLTLLRFTVVTTRGTMTDLTNYDFLGMHEGMFDIHFIVKHGDILSGEFRSCSIVLAIFVPSFQR